MNTDAKTPLPPWLPFVVGGLLVAQFAGLGVWQVSRGLEKAAAQDAFASAGSFAQFNDGMDVRSYQPLKATGRYLADRQFLLDNIILNSRYGYYVLTPLDLGDEAPLLMVNRGWIEKSGPTPDLSEVAAQIGATESRVTVRGRVGSLPRAGVRMGDAIIPRPDWPQVAVFPLAADLEAMLERQVQPFVLLMDPQDDDGFLRHWVPPEMGPSRHYGYAFQWFAMGAVLAGLLVWHHRRRAFADD